MKIMSYDEVTAVIVEMKEIEARAKSLHDKLKHAYGSHLFRMEMRFLAHSARDAEKFAESMRYKHPTALSPKFARKCRLDASRTYVGLKRIVEDAVWSYNQLYYVAPNDDTERELKQRAKAANEWLVSVGGAPVKVVMRKGKAVRK